MAAVAVAFSMSLAVTGCAGGGESDRDDRLTVDGAKTETMAIEIFVTGPGGAASVGRFDESSHLVTLASASRCFALREGENSYDTY